MPSRAIIAIGSNLNEPKARVRIAIRQLNRIASTMLVKQSSLYLTSPWGFTEQPEFINACALVDTFLAPHDLLRGLHDIEASHGRVRGAPGEIENGPRPLDMDLIAYDDLVVNTPTLTLPHPRVHERAFVLIPLAEIAPDVRFVGRGTVAEMARQVSSEGVVRLE
jgi:2-amino-4-hydroxy-6-hydroxymethyldihydropteridine diphosphokinase